MKPKLDASDIVQQTLLDAYQGWEEYRGGSEAELAAWLRRILANNLARATRDYGRARRDIALERSLSASLDDSAARLERWLAVDDSSPSHRASQNERIGLVARALAEVPDLQREALVLRYWHGYTLREIANHIQRSTSTAASLLYRAMKTLEERLSLVGLNDEHE